VLIDCLLIYCVVIIVFYCVAYSLFFSITFDGVCPSLIKLIVIVIDLASCVHSSTIQLRYEWPTRPYIFTPTNRKRVN